MAASYPGTIRVFTTKRNIVDVVDAGHPNTAQDEIVAMQTITGLNPHVSTSGSGSTLGLWSSAARTYATISDRLANLEIGDLSDTHTQYIRFANTETVTGYKTFVPGIKLGDGAAGRAAELLLSGGVSGGGNASVRFDTDGAQKWLLYKNQGDPSFFIRDSVNARQHVTFQPGVSDAAAGTTLHSTLTVAGNTSLLSTLTVGAATQINSTLGVTGATTINSNLFQNTTQNGTVGHYLFRDGAASATGGGANGLRFVDRTASNPGNHLLQLVGSDFARLSIETGGTGTITMTAPVVVNGTLSASGGSTLSGAVTFGSNAYGAADNTAFGWDGSATTARMGFSKKSGQGPKLAYSSNSAFIVTEYAAQTDINPAGVQTDRFTINAGGSATFAGALQVNGALNAIGNLNVAAGTVTSSGIGSFNGALVGGGSGQDRGFVQDASNVALRVPVAGGRIFFERNAGVEVYGNLSAVGLRLGDSAAATARLDVNGDGKFSGSLSVQGNVSFGTQSAVTLNADSARVNQLVSPLGSNVGNPAMVLGGSYLTSVLANFTTFLPGAFTATTTGSVTTSAAGAEYDSAQAYGGGVGVAITPGASGGTYVSTLIGPVFGIGVNLQYQPFVQVAAGSFPIAIRVELRRADNVTWVVAVNDTAPAYRGGLWVAPNYGAPDAVTGVRYTLTYNAGAPGSFIRELGLGNSSVQLGRNVLPDITRNNDWYGSNTFRPQQFFGRQQADIPNVRIQGESTTTQFAAHYGTETNPRLQLGIDVINGGKSGIAFNNPGSNTATGGAAVGLDGLRTLGLYVSNGTQLVPRLTVNGAGDMTINAIPTVAGLLTANAGVKVAGGGLDLNAVGVTIGTAAVNNIGDKLTMFASNNASRYGFGIQSSRLVAFVDSTAAFSVRATPNSTAQASSGTDAHTFFGNGDAAHTGSLTTTGAASFQNSVVVSGTLRGSTHVYGNSGGATETRIGEVGGDGGLYVPGAFMSFYTEGNRGWVWRSGGPTKMSLVQHDVNTQELRLFNAAGSVGDPANYTTRLRSGYSESSAVQLFGAFDQQLLRHTVGSVQDRLILGEGVVGAGGSLSLRHHNVWQDRAGQNATLRIGPSAFSGTASTVPGTEVSRHEIVFSTYRDNVQNQIGARIAAVNLHAFGAGSQALVQSTHLSFFTASSSGNANGGVATSALSDSSIEYMRLTSSGALNLLSGDRELRFDNKEAIRGQDTLLRINQSSAFTGGIWTGNSNMGGGVGSHLVLGSDGNLTTGSIVMVAGPASNTRKVIINGGSGEVLLAPNLAAGTQLSLGPNGSPGNGLSQIGNSGSNLHIDAATSGGGIYLNWFGGDGGPGTIFGSANTSEVGRVDLSGNASFSGTGRFSGVLRGALRARFGINSQVDVAPLTPSVTEFELSSQSMVTVGEAGAGSANPAITLYRTYGGNRQGTAWRLHKPGSDQGLQFQFGRTDNGAGLGTWGSETYATQMTIGTTGVLTVGDRVESPRFLATQAANSVGSPAYAFVGDPDSGMYSIADTRIGFSTNGGLRFEINGTAEVTAHVPLRSVSTVTGTKSLTDAGTVAAPSHSFTTDLDSGMYNPAADVVALGVFGNERLRVELNNVIVNTGLTVAVNGITATAGTSSFSNANFDTAYLAATTTQAGLRVGQRTGSTAAFMTEWLSVGNSTILAGVDRSGVPTFNKPSFDTANSGPTIGLQVGVNGSTAWNKFTVKGTTLWGDGVTSAPGEDVAGGTRYATIGAGGSSGIMMARPHLVWNPSDSLAEMRFGRMGGISDGNFWYAGAGTGRGGVAKEGRFAIGVGGGAPTGRTGNMLWIDPTGSVTRTRGTVRAASEDSLGSSTSTGVDLLLEALLS